MKKILFSSFVLAQLFMSCTSDLENSTDALMQENDELFDLITQADDRLDEIAYEKVRFTHHYASDEENTFTDSHNLYFSGASYQYIKDNGDGTYTIQIYGWEGPDDDIEIGFQFIYDNVSQQATEIVSYYIDYDNRYDDAINMSKAKENIASDITKVEVTNVNIETGEVAATFILNYIEGSVLSLYGQPGEVIIDFDGVLRKVYAYPEAQE